MIICLLWTMFLDSRDMVDPVTDRMYVVGAWSVVAEGRRSFMLLASFFSFDNYVRTVGVHTYNTYF